MINCESSPGSFDECRLSAGWPPTLRPSQSTWAVSQLPSTSAIAIFIITQPISWYSFHRLTEGKRLSRPRHCSKDAQPVPKAVYRSGCRDKNNRQQCGSNVDPLTPQSDALTTRLLWCAISNSSAIYRVKWRHRVYGHDTIDILRVLHDLMRWVKWRRFIVLFK